MSDEWAVPAGMTPQDNPGQPKDGIGALVKRVRDNAVEMRDRFNNLLKQAGIRVEKDLVRFLGAVRIEGDVRIMGAAHIEGTLSLPAGIIDNDALANPVAQDSDWGATTNFPITGTWTERASATIVVPAGFTRIQFYAIASITARNDVGTTQYLMARIRRQINGTGTVYGGIEPLATVPDAYWATALAPYNWGEGAAGGDSHRLWVEAWTGGGTWSADPVHSARIEVSAVFSR